jgi:hypothetical protein
MTWVEIYVVALVVVTPLAAALIAFVVCWRDRHRSDRSADHRFEEFRHTTRTR